MAFFFRLRYRLPHEVKTKGQAALIVTEIRLKSQLGEYYDGETIELIEEPKGWVHDTFKQLLGKK